MARLVPRKSIAILDLGLIVLLIVGGVLAWRSGRERQRAEAELATLRNLVGELELVDPTMIHIKALDTGEPLHYAWRVYLPAGFDSKFVSKYPFSGGTSWSSSSTTHPSHFIARVRLRRNDQDDWEIFKKFHQGSSRSSLGNSELTEIFDNHASSLVIERLGDQKMEVFGVDESRDLLRILLPPSLRDKYRGRYAHAEGPRFGEILSVAIGEEKRAP